jgi:hypothetical protein
VQWTWRRIGHPGPKQKRQESGQVVFSQAIKGTAICYKCDHYRQAEELQRGEGRSTTQCRTPPTEVSEQPSGKFSSAPQIVRAGDETLQVTGSRTTVSLSLRNHCLTLPSGTTPVPSLRIPRSAEIKIRPLGNGNWSWHRCSLGSDRQSTDDQSGWSQLMIESFKEVKLTMPLQFQN